MKILFASFLVIATTFGLPTLKNDKTLIQAPLVIGGKEVTKNEIPYQISVRNKDEHICGGALLSENFVLTSAQCVLFGSPSSFSVVAGQHSLASVDGTEEVRGISRIIPHQNFDFLTFDNDIALLKLSTPFLLNDSVKKIAIPPAGYNSVGDGFQVTGWGAVVNGGIRSDELRKASTTVLMDQVCQSFIGGSFAASKLCASSYNFCEDDTGGPLTTIFDNAPLLVGIASRNVNGCGTSSSYSVYTEISQFVAWINANAV